MALDPSGLLPLCHSASVPLPSRRARHWRCAGAHAAAALALGAALWGPGAGGALASAAAAAHAQRAARSTGRLATIGVSAERGGAAAPVLAFIEDDFGSARVRAGQQGKLLVVDLWAPWCHTCLSMRHFVFTDPLLRPVSDRFVYLSIDTERSRNADFLARFPIQSWPTLLVLDPRAGDRVLARWTGGMTAEELLARLRQIAAFAHSAGNAPSVGLLVEADAAAAEGQWAEAGALYARAAQQPMLRPRALLGQIQALRQQAQYVACAALADSAFAQVGRSAAVTDFAAYAADCLDKDSNADRRQQRRRRLREALLAVVKDPAAALLVDDRSDGYGTLIELSDALGDQAGGDAYAEARLRLLEAAAFAARTPADAATYDAHRLDSYRRLKQYQPAEQMLLASYRALPGDYNPPARLARLYYEMGQLDSAEHYISVALAHSYGPRRANLYELQASIQTGLGQPRAAMQSLQAAIDVLQTPPGGGPPRPSPRAESLRKRIAALTSTLPPAPPAPLPSVPPAATPATPASKPSPAPPRKTAPRYAPGAPVAQSAPESPTALPDARRAATLASAKPPPAAPAPPRTASPPPRR